MMAVPDELETVDVGEWHARVERAHCDGFAMFDWLTAVDRMDSGTPGFDVVVRLIALPEVNSATGVRGIRLTARVADGQSLASITDLYAGAAWHERETFEMFGVFFDGFADHTDLGLRPLLLPDGFEGTPLRKSFQLAARASKTWPGGKEPGEGHDTAKSPSRRRVQAPGVPPPEWGPR